MLLPCWRDVAFVAEVEDPGQVEHELNCVVQHQQTQGDTGQTENKDKKFARCIIYRLKTTYLFV